MGNYLFISDAAKEVKVESHVLRYWEEELHLPIKRNELGHRYYTEEDVERFKQIKGMKERGLQLKAIKMILRDGRLDVLSGGETEPGAGMLDKQAAAEPDKTDRQDISDRQDKSDKQDKSAFEETAQDGEKAPELPINIVDSRDCEIQPESKENKAKRLQWLLQQLIRETLKENNSELCREIKESVVKELDYQFRMQEEREEARDRMLAERDEEHYKRMDELLRKKSRHGRKYKVVKPEKPDAHKDTAESEKISFWGKKKKRFE